MKQVIRKPQEVYNLYNLTDPFLRYLSAVIKLSSISVKNYASDIRHFTGWFNRYIAFVAEYEATSQTELLILLTQKTIEEYRDSLIEGKIPFKSINRRLSSIRSFCAFAVSQGWLDENPARNIRNVNVYSPTTPKGSTANQNENVLKSICSPEEVEHFKKYSHERNVIVTEELLHDVNEFLSCVKTEYIFGVKDSKNIKHI